MILTHNEGTKVHTKYISLKWHHSKDWIKVTKVDSNLNWTNIFTKPLSKVKHESLRRFIIGWWTLAPLSISSHEGGYSAGCQKSENVTHSVIPDPVFGPRGSVRGRDPPGGWAATRASTQRTRSGYSINIIPNTVLLFVCWHVWRSVESPPPRQNASHSCSESQFSILR